MTGMALDPKYGAILHFVFFLFYFELIMQSYLSGNTGIRIVTPTQEIKAHVVPISKSNPASADNLRPVSLIHHFAKIAENFIAKWAV